MIKRLRSDETDFTGKRSLRRAHHGVNYYIKSISLALSAFYQEIWNRDVEVTRRAILARAFRIPEVMSACMSGGGLRIPCFGLPAARERYQKIKSKMKSCWRHFSFGGFSHHR